MKLNKLQHKLAAQICEYLKELGYPVDVALKASSLAEKFAVSRTPVRVALQYLSDKGVVANIPNRGFFSVEVSENKIETIICDFADAQVDLVGQIAEDRVSGSLEETVTESHLMRKYNVDRVTLLSVLTELEGDGLVHENPGRGWSFIYEVEALQESYNYRKIILANCLLESTFSICYDAINECRTQHEEYRQDTPPTVKRFVEINANFYSVIAQCSGNRFVQMTIKQQSRIRRFRDFTYKGKNNHARLPIVYDAHMAVLDAIEQGDVNLASSLLWVHLDKTAKMQKNLDRVIS